MIKKLILICALLMGISAFAEDVPIVLTPVHKISTANKNLMEGDVLEFKDVNTGEIITGVLKELTPNGFAGEQASIYIDNFKYKDSGKPLSGEVFVKGGEHKKHQEFANNISVGATSLLIRGGEVILQPDKTKMMVFFSDYIKSEDTPVRITPAQKISTSFDEIEVGDKIKFSFVKDVYKDGQLYLKKGSPIYGIVDYVDDNGWYYDNAQIDFKYFKTKTVDGKTITITSPVSINGFEILKYKSNRPAQFFNYCGVAFRGKEVDINPEKEKIQLNIWVK